MNFSKIDSKFNDFDFILIVKFSIASLKSIVYNEIIIIFEILFILNSIFYFFFFSLMKFHYNIFSNLINSFFFLKIVVFLVAFFNF